MKTILARIEEKIDRILRRLEAPLQGVFDSTELLRDPSRKAVYDLCDGKHSVNDIVEALRSVSREISQSRVSQILSELVEAGLIESRRGLGENWRLKYYVKITTG